MQEIPRSWSESIQKDRLAVLERLTLVRPSTVRVLRTFLPVAKPENAVLRYKCSAERIQRNAAAFADAHSQSRREQRARDFRARGVVQVFRA